MKERITVESLGNGTGVTVRVWGWPVGLSRVLHFLGYRDTTMARHLEDEAATGRTFVPPASRLTSQGRAAPMPTPPTPGRCRPDRPLRHDSEANCVAEMGQARRST
jgi:hypothetical protein